MKKEEKTLVHEDKLAKTAHLKSIEQGAVLLQNLVNEWLALNIQPLKDTDLADMYNDPAGFYNNAVEARIKELPQYGGFGVSMEALKSQLELPNPARFYGAVEAAKAHMKRPGKWVDPETYTFKGGVIEVNQEVVEQILSNYKTYAETPKEKEAARLLMEWVNATLALNEYTTGPNKPGPQLIQYGQINAHHWLRSCPQTGEVNLNVEAYNILSRG